MCVASVRISVVVSILFLSVPVGAVTSASLSERVLSILGSIYAMSTSDFAVIVQEEETSIQSITGAHLYERMQQEPDLLVINVLTERWYNDCHIEGSINIPLRDLLRRIQDVDKQRPIVVYCALEACNGGQKAYLLLKALGFTNIADYAGGIKDWFQSGYPTAGPCAESYLHEPYEHRTICLQGDN